MTRSGISKAEANRVKARRWLAANRETARERSRRWKAANPEKARAINRESSRRWAAANPDKKRKHRHTRRARQHATEGTWSVDDLERIRKLQRNRCAEPTCRTSLKNRTAHIDHIKPLARGGSNWPANLQLLCETCNRSKGAQDPIEHARNKGRLL